MEGVEVGQGEEVAVDLEVKGSWRKKGYFRGGSRGGASKRGGSRKAGSSKSGSGNKSKKSKPKSLHQVKKEKCGIDENAGRFFLVWRSSQVNLEGVMC